MVLKRLYSGAARGTNAALPATNIERIVLYTVPASKVAVIKNIFYRAHGNNASVYVTLYLLKSGGTDTAGTENAYAINATPGAAVIPITAQTLTNSSTMVNLVTTIILEASDALKMELVNGTGGNINAPNFGMNVHVSGDET